MFTPEFREKLRAEILSRAGADARLAGGAVTGSATTGELDTWSDIDLAFGVQDSAAIADVLSTYTTMMYEEFGACHHLDVFSGPWIYRVFLLSNTLQVDLAFVPIEHFGARASTFKLVFGQTGRVQYDPPADFEGYVGWIWLSALHARSSLERRKLWQAEYFISGMRDYLISMICRRHGLPEKQGRGVDRLPQLEMQKLSSTVIRSIDIKELRRAFAEVLHLSLQEVERTNRKLADQIRPALHQLAPIEL